MNQIKYSAYALLLVFATASVALYIDNLSFPTHNQDKVTQISAETTSKSAAPVVNAFGKNVFQSNCQTCHALDKVVTGPALRGVNERGPWTERKNLIKWVHNPAAMIPTLAYTKELASAFGGQVMPSFPQLSEKEINAIFDYIKTASTPGGYGDIGTP
jgi:mono/diheme cytochrome c family protein